MTRVSMNVPVSPSSRTNEPPTSSCERTIGTVDASPRVIDGASKIASIVIVEVEGVVLAGVVEARSDLDLEVHRPAAQRTRRTSRWRSMSAGSPAIGMKSWISPTPSGVKKRVIRTFVSGK